MKLISEEIEKKWAPVLEHSDIPAIADPYRRAVTGVLLENTQAALREANLINEDLTSADTATGSIKNTDPVLISLVRRAMPHVIAYDICGVQPMKMPTGQIFCLKARYGDIASDSNKITTADSEALFNEADSDFSGPSSLATGEGDINGTMGFTIEKTTVTANTRALKASYTVELAQDLRVAHGLDAEAELSNILASEILSEVNREIVRSIRLSAQSGATQTGIQSDGVFDLIADADGRWAVERFQSLLFQFDLEANSIFTTTRRGKGNWAMVHADVASAIAATGRLNSKGIGENISSDYAGNTLVGTVGNMKIYVDPYAPAGSVVVGYKGASPFDAGFFYCPYTPLMPLRAVDQDTFQPRIGYKTRYGVAHNPIVNGQGGVAAPVVNDAGVLTSGSNPYFRAFTVTSINLDS